MIGSLSILIILPVCDYSPQVEDDQASKDHHLSDGHCSGVDHSGLELSEPSCSDWDHNELVWDPSELHLLKDRTILNFFALNCLTQIHSLTALT